VTQKTSQNGINLIKEFEGCVLHAYKPLPTEKWLTIGYGHYGSDVKQGQTITQAEAEELLKKDLKRYEDGVNAAVKVAINQNQFDALVSFSYNLGIYAMTHSDLVGFINKGDFKAASAEFPKWCHAGGKVITGLVRRRNEERELFDKPVPKPKPKPKQTVKVYHTVVKGETLSGIAAKFKTTVAKLDALNPQITNLNLIHPGQKIRVK
jgi:GH24 family phage-related lysozyme (muramidase)